MQCDRFVRCTEVRIRYGPEKIRRVIELIDAHYLNAKMQMVQGSFASWHSRLKGECLPSPHCCPSSGVWHRSFFLDCSIVSIFSGRFEINCFRTLRRSSSWDRWKRFLVRRRNWTTFSCWACWLSCEPWVPSIVGGRKPVGALSYCILGISSTVNPQLNVVWT
jgi:hypothetical protein